MSVIRRERNSVSRNITAESQYTEWIQFFNDGELSLSGSWTATVWLQWSFDDGVTVEDVESYTANAAKVIDADGSAAVFRLGVKEGGFTTGTVVASLRRRPLSRKHIDFSQTPKT